MEIAGKSLRRRVGTALAVLLVLVAYDYATGPSIDWVVNLIVPPLFFLFSLATDAALRRWLDGRE